MNLTVLCPQDRLRKLEAKEVLLAADEEPVQQPTPPPEPDKLSHSLSEPLTLAQVAAANASEPNESAPLPAAVSATSICALHGFGSVCPCMLCEWVVPAGSSCTCGDMQAQLNAKLARRQRELEEEEAERKRKDAAAAKLRALDEAIAAREAERYLLRSFTRFCVTTAAFHTLARIWSFTLF